MRAFILLVRSRGPFYLPVATDGSVAPSSSRWVTPSLALATLAVVATRILARQATPWEWDDLVFGLALDIFAPQSQVPQPPFYPGFVFLGRLVRLIVVDNHAALTWLSVIASSLVPVFCFFVATGFGFSRRVSMTTAGLLAFFPAIWFHSGVPLSDPAGLAAGLGAMALGLRANRSPRTALVAAAALGVAVSIRPQSALPAAVALAISCGSLARRQKLGIAAVAVTSVGLLYVTPIVIAAGGLSGVVSWSAYQASFVLDHDSLAAHHWAIPFMLRHYFLDIWASPALAIVVLAFSLGGGMRIWKKPRRKTLGTLLVVFLPYALLSWAFLDPSTAGRYALPYLPLVALLVAVGTVWVDGRLGFRRLPVTGTILIAAMAALSVRAVLLVHEQASPPVAAARAILAAQKERPSRLVYAPLLRMHAHAFFPDAELVAARSAADLCSIPLDAKPTWLYGMDSGGGVVVSWPDLAFLRRVGRGRYLEVRWQRRDEACVEYADGFFRPERTPHGHTFRWMGAGGLVRFAAVGAGAQVDVTGEVPLWALDGPPEVTISLNGHELRRVVARDAQLSVSFSLPSSLLRSAPLNEMTISVNKTFVPAESGKGPDRRRLGLQIQRMAISRPQRPQTAEAPSRPAT